MSKPLQNVDWYAQQVVKIDSPAPDGASQMSAPYICSRCSESAMSALARRQRLSEWSATGMPIQASCMGVTADTCLVSNPPLHCLEALRTVSHSSVALPLAMPLCYLSAPGRCWLRHCYLLDRSPSA